MIWKPEHRLEIMGSRHHVCECVINFVVVNFFNWLQVLSE